MRIGIAGLGSAGTYLARRLTDSGFDVTAFDPKRPGYYIPCGYAANENSMSEFMKKIGFDFSSYILSRAESITFTGTNMPDFSFNSLGLCTFDKNRLENDIIKTLSARNERLNGDFDIVIDATGVSRSLLGPAENDFLMYAREYVTENAEHEDFYFRYFQSGRGYFWEFPLGERNHVGAGSSELDLIDESLSGYTPLKVTARKIRLKPLFDQFARGKIIGVGESIGTVSPITGEGIVPSIECAEILYESLSRYTDLEDLKAAYIQSVMRRFRHYEKLFDLLVNFRSGRRMSYIGLTAVRSAVKTMKEFGIDFRISRVIRHLV